MDIEKRARLPIPLIIVTVGLILTAATIYLLGGYTGDWGSWECCMYCGLSVFLTILLVTFGWRLMVYRYTQDLVRVLEAGRSKARTRERRMEREREMKMDDGIVETEGRVLVKCRRCKKSIPEDARRCRHCGARVRRKEEEE